MKQHSIYLSLLLVIAHCSSITNRLGLTLTIYNDGFALVKDRRRATVDKGTSTLFFTDVPSSIVSETVMAKTDPSVQVYEQSFENNLVNR